jgi:hypothetical protein
MASIIRDKIVSGHYSRDAKDVAVCLAYFSRILNKRTSKRDLDAYIQLIGELKYLQVNTLRS